MAFEAEIVLGGEGFIGGYLVKELRRRGAKVFSYDIKNGYDLREGPPPLEYRNSYVWFLAWDVGGAKFITNAACQLDILQNNLMICQNVFPWIVENNLPTMFAGTQMAGYANSYGATKAVAQCWAGLLPQCSISRFWNVYGIEQETSERSHVMTDMLFAGMQGCVKCGTAGTERRQWVYVQDAVEAMIHQRQIGQRCADITTGQWVPVRECAALIAKELNVPVQCEEKPGYESLVDPTMLLQGWAPRFSLADGVHEMIREHTARKADKV
jgi:nucleoside-diphosphate-sugar epimerase